MKLLSFFSALVCLFLLSCRQEADITAPVKYEGGILVNFNNYEMAEGNTSYLKYEVPLKDTLINVNVEVKLTNTTETAPEDIYVYLIKTDALVSGYNTANGTTLSNVSNSDAALQYDFSKPVVIKKGTRRTTINMTVNPSKLDLSRQNAIGIGILRVEGAGAAINNTVAAKLVIEFGARNQYDGRYLLKGAFYHPVSQPNNARYSIEVLMISSGANSVKIYSEDFGGYYHPWLDATGSITAFSGQEPEYTVNPSNNKVVVQNSAPGAVTFYEMNPLYNSRYESGNRTIYAQFGYGYVGGNFVLGTSRQFTDTLVYLGPR
jgi:hypothetical protein